MELAEPVDVLAFAPHPDDVELSAGGLMLRLSHEGRRLVVVDFTRGEGGSRGDPQTRAEETQEASRLMGLIARENLGLPDTALESNAEMTRPVLRAIRRWRPRVVLGPCPVDLHPDHVAAAQLVQRAYYLATVKNVPDEDLPPHRPNALVHYYGHKEPTPTFVVDVSEVWERRRELVRCYASQLGLDGRDGPETNVSAPGFLRRYEARYAYWGARIGADYAEPFLADRIVPVDDLVGTFRKRGSAVL